MSSAETPNERLYVFAAGDAGPWRIVRIDSIAGESLAPARALSVHGGARAAAAQVWALRGVVSNERYVTRTEREQLAFEQEPLGRRHATCAALIPIRKSEAWWNLAQDERRRIFEERSHHVRIGRQYLPAIARRLHHCRDLGAAEPFDFLTWFEFAPSQTERFEELLAQLRATEEWRYVTREVDVHLVREAL